MSLYRQAGRRRRNRRLALAAGATTVVIAIVVIVLASSGGPPSHADRVKSARSAANEALDGLEILSVEYGQAVKAGQVAAPTEYAGARSDAQRAQQSLSDHRADFEAVDAAAYRRARRALAAVAAAVAGRADIAAAERAARSALASFTSG